MVAPKVDGWVERLRVNATGQPVRRGESLLDLYSPMVLTAEQELLLAKGLSSQVAGAEEDARVGATNLVEAARRRLLAWDIPPGDIEAVISRRVRPSTVLPLILTMISSLRMPALSAGPPGMTLATRAPCVVLTPISDAIAGVISSNCTPR